METKSSTPVSKNLTWHHSKLTDQQRETKLGQKGAVIWFTGLSGSGKSSLAFDTLYADSQKTARVMGIPLHPFLTGEPWRTPYLKKAIAHFQQHERVWFATGSEIADAYLRLTS